MILELDAGNSRLKWRLLGAAGVRQEGDALAIDENWAAALPAEGITRIRAACVAGAGFERALRAWAQRQGDLEVEFARTTALAGGVRCAYADPSRMGVDRWLAVLSAHQITGGGPCLVVDCGSAVTLDFVAPGEHRGGYILPGARLMRQSLLAGTAEIAWRTPGAEPSTEPGRGTEEAIANGSLRALATLVDSAAASAETLLLTGGDAHWLATALTAKFEHRPELVLDGLALALP